MSDIFLGRQKSEIVSNLKIKYYQFILIYPLVLHTIAIMCVIIMIDFYLNVGTSRYGHATLPVYIYHCRIHARLDTDIAVLCQSQRIMSLCLRVMGIICIVVAVCIHHIVDALSSATTCWTDFD